MATLCISNKYFLSKENIYKLNKNSKRFLLAVNTIKKQDKQQVIIEKKESKYFFPDIDKDYLFWCWYIFSNGIDEFYMETEMLSNNSPFTFKKNIKIRLIEKLRKNKKKLKEKKIKLANIENNLLYDNELTLETFISLITLKGYNMIFINEKLFYELYNDTDKKTVYISQEKGKYGIFIDQPYPECSELKKTKMVVENINKPLMAISSYKADEIRDLCKKFDIDIIKTGKKYKTKKELYLLLQEYLI